MVFTSKQEKVLIGTMLGDGFIQQAETKSCNCRLRISHSLTQKDYVIWKYQIFKNICKSTKKPFVDSSKKNHIQYAFYSSYLKELKPYRAAWYKEETLMTKLSYKETKVCYKRLPSNIAEILVDPLSLAVWYMDDGTKRTDTESCRLATQNFGEAGTLILQDCLQNNFDIDAKIDKWQAKSLSKHSVSTKKELYGLAILSRSGAYKKFLHIVEEIIRTQVPSMSYKIKKTP